MIVFKSDNAYELSALLANRFRKLGVALRILVARIAGRGHQQECVTLQCIGWRSAITCCRMVGHLCEKVIGGGANRATREVGGFAVVSEILGPFFGMCGKSAGGPIRVPGGKRGNADPGWLMRTAKQGEPCTKAVTDQGDSCCIEVVFRDGFGCSEPGQECSNIFEAVSLR